MTVIAAARPPCRADPAAWDIPDRQLTPLDLPRIRWAMARCRRCPALQACRADTAAHPPKHRCVQAGRVHGIRGML